MKMYKGEYGIIEEIQVKSVIGRVVLLKDGSSVFKDGLSRWYRESKEAVKACMVKDSEGIIGYRELALAEEKEKLEKIKAL